jgi:hypothetical protein
MVIIISMKTTLFHSGLVSDSSHSSSFLLSLSSLSSFLLIWFLLNLILFHLFLLINNVVGRIHDFMQLLRFNTNTKEGNKFVTSTISLKKMFNTCCIFFTSGFGISLVSNVFCLFCRAEVAFNFDFFKNRQGND